MPASPPSIAIVAPSGYAPEPMALALACERLNALGCQVRCLVDEGERFQRFGASDARRAAQLHEAAADPEVQIVLALRGGYGLSRLLPMLDFPALAGSGKLFVGHSDFTLLHMGLLAHGAASFAGPMVCADFSREPPNEWTLQDFWSCLRGPEHQIRFTSVPHAPIDLGGVLWGGNLTMLVHLAGTPWQPKVEGGILFLEDVNEHPYRIERMLLQMEYAGMIAGQQAIVLGDFSGYRLSEYDNGYDFDAMRDYLQQRFGLPVLTGLPFGHIAQKATLAVGSHARLQSDGSQCVLTMRDYRTL